MTTLHQKRFPNETAEYRTARDQLLAAELALREQIEQVAALRRRLPAGGEVPQDYTFHEGSGDFRDTTTVREVRLSELLGDKDTLVLINFMFHPDKDTACRMCTMWADTYNAAAPHVEQRVAFALVARAELGKLRAWAAARGWHNLRLLSSRHSPFARDYHAEFEDGSQNASITVFTRKPNGPVRHFYTIEANLVPSQGDPRHIDLLSPVWNLLDLTPDGRGDWYPSYSYR